jgi:hypothetical protein
MPSRANTILASYGLGLASNSNNNAPLVKRSRIDKKSANTAKKSANSRTRKNQSRKSLVTDVLNFAEVDLSDLVIGQPYEFRNKYDEITRKGIYMGHDEGHPTHF